MNFLNQYRGHLICAGLGILVGALLVLWIKGSKTKTILPNPVVDTPAATKPVFDSSDSGNTIHKKHITIHYPPKRLGGSIGKVSIAESTTTPPETVYQQPSPCKPFSLRLKSSPISLSESLDSVLVFYEYPSGMHTFEYYNRPSSVIHTKTSGTNGGFLRFGFSIGYVRYQNNLYGNAYVSANLFGLNPRIGYHHQTRQQLSWFVSVGKEWRVF